MVKRREELGKLLTLDQGKPLKAEALGEVDESIEYFCSSGRRHTRSYGDWSSDVCSSDLVEGVGPLLVVKTPAGGAQGLGLAIDAAGWTEIIGTIAGDEAVLVITRSERARRAVQTRLKELAGIPD